MFRVLIQDVMKKRRRHLPHGQVIGGGQHRNWYNFYFCWIATVVDRGLRQREDLAAAAEFVAGNCTSYQYRHRRVIVDNCVVGVSDIRGQDEDNYIIDRQPTRRK